MDCIKYFVLFYDINDKRSYKSDIIFINEPIK